MAKTSTRPLSLPRQKNRRLRSSLQHRLSLKSGGWLLGLSVGMLMWVWNWKLLMATGSGAGVMFLAYRMQAWNWQVPLSQLRQFLEGSNRQFTVAAGAGILATLSTYLAVSVWLDAESSWVATGAIFQGFGTLTVLLLLVWQILDVEGSRDEAKINQLVMNLTDADPLVRLIAVRQLTRLTCRQPQQSNHRNITVDYFRLLLNQETESVIQEAILEGLQALNAGMPAKPTSQQLQPLYIPTQKNQVSLKEKEPVN